MGSDRGSAMPLVAALLLGGALLLTLAVQVGLAAGVWREADAAATAGAGAGAAQIDHDAARSGILRLDTARAIAAARSAALAYRPRPGRSVTVVTGGDRICVTVAQTARPGPLSLAGARPVRIVARECARPHVG